MIKETREVASCVGDESLCAQLARCCWTLLVNDLRIGKNRRFDRVGEVSVSGCWVRGTHSGSACGDETPYSLVRGGTCRYVYQITPSEVTTVATPQVCEQSVLCSTGFVQAVSRLTCAALQ